MFKVVQKYGHQCILLRNPSLGLDNEDQKTESEMSLAVCLDYLKTALNIISSSDKMKKIQSINLPKILQIKNISNLK